MSTTTETTDRGKVIEDALRQYITRMEGRETAEDSKPFIPSTVWASQYSGCARQLTLRMTKGHELPPFPVEALARFRRGKDRARNIKADLEQAGRDATPPFELQGAESRFVLEWNGIEVVSGKVDWKTKFLDNSRSRPIPTEFKSWSPLLTDRINTFEDLFENRWTRKGAFQLLSYMWGDGSETGIMVLDRPSLPKILPVSLFAAESKNLLRVEAFLTTAYKAVKAKVEGVLPDYTTNVEECKSCDFLGSHCTPPSMAGSGLSFISDEELASHLDRRGELLEAHKEFEALDKSIKAALRGKEMAVVGDWMIHGAWQKQTKTVVPVEHQKLFDSWKETDPKGKFALKFFKVGGADKEGQGDD